MILANTIEDEWQDKLDDQMQKGYTESAKGHATAASNIWMEFWEMIKQTLDAYEFEYIEDMDNAFHGLQSLFNWSTDFEMELYKASSKDNRFLRQRIDFCSDYIIKSRVKNDGNNLVRKRVIAESYFLLGKTQQGEEHFQSYVKQHPSDNWGWINWSDQYGIFALEENRDHEKAIAILQKGLEVSGTEDRAELFLRLKDLYTQEGMEQAANEVSEKIRKEEKKEPQRIANRSSFSPVKETVTAAATGGKKIGRNEPCPCGSGKKYKKCCGQ